MHMGYQWATHELPIGYLGRSCATHGLPRGYPIGHPQATCGFLTEFHQNLVRAHGMFTSNKRATDGSHMSNPWATHGLPPWGTGLPMGCHAYPMGCRLDTHGCPWIEKSCPWDVHKVLTGYPCGTHGQLLGYPHGPHKGRR